MSSVAVFSSLLSSGSPGEGSLLARFVYCYSVRCVVFALWAVRVDFFWKFRLSLHPRREGLGAPGVLLFITLSARSDLNGCALADEALRILVWQNCNVLFVEGSVCLQVDPDYRRHVFDES